MLPWIEQRNFCRWHLIHKTREPPGLKMKYFPVYLDLENQPVLMVGDGESALQKIRLLIKTTAKIFLIGETVHPEIKSLMSRSRVTWLRRDFREDDVLGKALVYAATDDQVLNQKVAAAARKHGVPVNVVDVPELCSFITPAIVDRSPVIIAIGTEGAAPILAREIKAKLEALLPKNYGALARYAQSLRDRIAAEVQDGSFRRKIWEKLLAGRFRRQVLADDLIGAEHSFETALRAYEPGRAEIGSVALVGCGPGDPDLLTLKAQQLLQSADVLVFDRLVNPEILEYARRDARRIHVGKTPGQISTSQDDINQILIDEALAGHDVVRLKGGDPFIFGRAVEELEALHSEDIPVTVVPGISAAHASAASIGLPLTMRARHRKFSVITGATVEGLADHDWNSLAREDQAFAIYMGVRMASAIQEKLLQAGSHPDTPVVIVEKATLPDQRSVVTRLEHLVQCIEGTGLHGPAIIFVGLSWAQAGLDVPDDVEIFEDGETLAIPAADSAVARKQSEETVEWNYG